MSSSQVWRFLLGSLLTIIVAYAVLLSFGNLTGIIIPVAGISYIVDGIVLSIVGRIVLGRAKNTLADNPIYLYLALFFILSGIFMILIGAAHMTLFLHPEMFMYAQNWGYITSHIFLYAANAYMARVLSLIFFPRFERPFFYVMLAGGAIVTIVNILLPGAPMFDVTNGLSYFNTDSLVGPLIPLVIIPVYIPAAILFAIQAFRTSIPEIRQRGILTAVGFAVLFVFGPLHDVAHTTLEYALADIFTLGGFFMIAGAVLLSHSASAFVRKQPVPGPQA